MVSSAIWIEHARVRFLKTHDLKKHTSVCFFQIARETILLLINNIDKTNIFANSPTRLYFCFLLIVFVVFEQTLSVNLFIAFKTLKSPTIFKTELKNS